MYYSSEPAGDYLDKVIQAHSDFILATTKAPLKPYPHPKNASVIVQEKTQVNTLVFSYPMYTIWPKTWLSHSYVLVEHRLPGLDCHCCNINLLCSGKSHLAARALVRSSSGDDLGSVSIPVHFKSVKCGGGQGSVEDTRVFLSPNFPNHVFGFGYLCPLIPMKEISTSTVYTDLLH